jgi:hypothetical protein
VETVRQRQSLTERALKKLEDDLCELEDAHAAAMLSVTVAIRQVTRPTVAKLVGQLREAKRTIAMTEGILGVLLLSETRPRFHDPFKERVAVNAVDAALGDLREEVRSMALLNNTMVHRPDAEVAAAAWSRALAELRLNPAASLPIKTEP